MDLIEDALQQVDYLRRHASQTDRGYICFYKKQMIMGRDEEEMLMLLRGVWNK